MCVAPRFKKSKEYEIDHSPFMLKLVRTQALIQEF